MIRKRHLDAPDNRFPEHAPQMDFGARVPVRARTTAPYVRRANLLELNRANLPGREARSPAATAQNHLRLKADLCRRFKLISSGAKPKRCAPAIVRRQRWQAVVPASASFR